MKISTLTVLISLSIAGFSISFISTPFLFNSVVGQLTSESLPPPPTAEQEQIGKDENGDKLEYNDCPGYDDGIDPSQYDSMTTEELGTITDNVDARILELNAKGSSIDEEEEEELECLEAIRAIENYAEKVKMPAALDEFREGLDLLQQKMTIDQKLQDFMNGN